MGMQRNGLRRGASRGRVGDTASTGSRKKKQNVMEIDGVLWALDEHGNPLKRLRKKNRESGGGGEAHHSSGGSTGAKRIKKNIIEIDGSPWLCDDNGKPIKKLRKKVKAGEEQRPARSKSQPARPRSSGGGWWTTGGGGYDSDGGNSKYSKRQTRQNHNSRSDSDSSTSDKPRRNHSKGNSLEKLISSGDSRSTRSGKKKKVREIDGQLWACDEQGKPIKKVRRKGDPKPTDAAPPRGFLPPPRGGGGSLNHGSAHPNNGNQSRPNPRSTGQPGSSYKDHKGRTHVFDEFGNETVYDRNGKKLRKKGAPKTSGLMNHILESTGNGSFYESNPKPSRPQDELETGLGTDFDNLWGNEAKVEQSVDNLRETLGLPPKPRPSTLRASMMKRSHTAGELDGLDPDELERQNKRLMEELQQARDEMRDLEEQAEREKKKNVKTQNDMLELKAKYTKASSEMSDLEAKVYDLTSQIAFKERQLAENKPAGAGAENVAELEAEKDNLASKLEMEKASAQQKIKQKEQELAKMNREMAVLRNEVEMLVTGRKGNQVDPTLKRLQDEKDQVEQKYATESEKNQAKIKSLEEMIEALETVNKELNKQMMASKSGNAGAFGFGGGASNAGPRNNIHTRTTRRGSNFERKPPEATRSFDGGWVSPGALFGRGRR